MIRGAISVAAIGLAILEATGFVAYMQYCNQIGQPIHFDAIPIFQLPAYSLPAYWSNFGYTFFFVAFIALGIWASTAAHAASTAPDRYRVIVVDRRKKTDVLYHFWHGFDFSDLPMAIRAPATILTGSLIAGFVLFSMGIASAQGEAMARDAKYGKWRPTAVLSPQRGIVRLYLAKEAQNVPTEVLHANSHGKLVLIDDTPADYVLSIAGEPRSPGRLYWLDRKDVSSVAFTYSPEPTLRSLQPPPAPPPSTTTTMVNVVTAIIGIFSLTSMVIYGRGVLLRRQRQRGTVESFETARIDRFDLPSTDLIAIFGTLRRGINVFLHVIESGAERFYFLRCADYQSLTLTLKEVPSDVTDDRASAT